MTALEIAIWSAASGAIALVVLVCVVDFALSRTMAAAHGALYNVAALAFVLVMSGLPQEFISPRPDAAMHIARVMVGPVAAALGDWWVRAWLAARHRDRLMSGLLLFCTVAAPLVGLAALMWLPRAQQVPVSGALMVANTAIVVWMCVRAWLLGDRLALGMASGAVIMLAAIGGLYAVAMNLPGLGTGWEAAVALASVTCVSIVASMLWQRNRHERRWRAKEPERHSQFDPVTKLPAGLPLVRQLVAAQKRRRMTRREGVLIAVILFQPERIVSQVGVAGLNEVYLHLAQRLQRQVGVVNPVGRYWDRCFVALVEAIHSPAALRTFGLRVASTLRRPMDVSVPGGGRRQQVRIDVGVGIVHLTSASASHEVEDLLHEAQELAESARAMASRAAMRDPSSGQVVPVEHARIGHRRGAAGTRSRGARVPHAA